MRNHWPYTNSRDPEGGAANYVTDPEYCLSLRAYGRIYIAHRRLVFGIGGFWLVRGVSEGAGGV